ncbi:DNA polymerase III subunit chi [Aliikangiella maris]|uniref:DNA polymerase III subunit chi n=2 Tax=Aliikangiella maris TaxID=3162458 RepID=A0ABV2BNG6_9GAMM
MTQVEFYSVESADPKVPYSHMCEVIKRAYRKGQKVFVHTQDRKQAETIDELLWSLDAASFLPHQLADEAPDTKPPIEIGFGQNPAVKPDVLINMAAQVPQFFSQFAWVFEYAWGDEEQKELARNRFRFYRERGYPLNHRKINS